MFHLRFTPRFAKQQKAFLAQVETPDLKLPREMLASLENFRTVDPKELAPGPITTRALWWLCFRRTRPIILKASLAACFAALCATASTLIAIRILKMDSSSKILLGFALAYFFSNSLSLFANYSTNRLRAELALVSETLLVALISNKLLTLSSQSAQEQSSGNLKVLITSDVKNIGEFLNNFIRNLIPSLAAIIIMAPFLIHFAGRAGWVSLFTLSLIIPISVFLNHINVRLQTLSQARMDEHASLVGEWVKNIRLVRFLGWDAYFEAQIKAIIRKFMKIALIQHLLACIVFGLSTTWWMVAGASVLLFAKLFHEPLEVSGYFGSLWLLTFIASYFTHLPNTIRVYGIAIPSMQRIAKLLQSPDQHLAFEVGITPAKNLKPVKIIFDQVSFRALKKVSIQVRLGQKTAILGEVGSGKTTFLNLLCGEHPPAAGKIWVEYDDGSRHSLWQKDVHAQLRSMLALVPQIPYVSSDFLGANISLNHDDMNEGDLLNSLQKAQMQEDLDSFPDRISQMIGESGVNLSGGQKQRLNLARAFHAKRDFLVLDDTLSAVDHRTEKALMQKISQSESGVLLVTHRLSEIKALGYVLVFQGGRLIEEGSPEALAKKPNSAFLKALGAYSDG